MRQLLNNSLPNTFIVHSHVELMQWLRGFAPTLIFTRTDAAHSAARKLAEEMAWEPINLTPHRMLKASEALPGSQDVALIATAGLVHGWHTSVPRSIVMWGNAWDIHEFYQARARVRSNFCPMFIYEEKP